MATKKTAAGYEFIVAALKKNPKADYASIRERAEKKSLTVYPIMFGRAQAALGIVKPKKRGKKKTTARRGPGRPRKATSRRGRSGGSAADAVRDLLGGLQDQERSNEELRRTLEKIRELIDRVL